MCLLDRRPSLAATVLAVVALLGAMAAARAQSSFYTASDQELAVAPGAIIRAQPIRRTPEGATAYRVLYRSTGLHDQPIQRAGVPHLGHVRQKVHLPLRQHRGLQPAHGLVVEHFTGDAFRAPLLIRRLFPRGHEFQAARALVAVVDAGPLAQLGRERVVERDAVSPQQTTNPAVPA